LIARAFEVNRDVLVQKRFSIDRACSELPSISEFVMNVDALIPKLVALWMIVMIVGFSIVALQKRHCDKKRIRDYLLDKGYRDIAIQYDWFDFDKSNATYQVTCRSPAGVRVMTTCKIHRWNEDIYWKTPL